MHRQCQLVSREGNWLGLLWWLGAEVRVSLQEPEITWFEVPTSTKGWNVWAFLSVHPDVREKGEEMCFEKSQSSKLESSYLLYFNPDG